LSGGFGRSGTRQVPDRRVRRSRDLLFQALIALIREKGYDRITVQDILDRADVGRSTFYEHYRGKDELLLSATEGLRSVLEQTLATTSITNAPEPMLQVAQALFGQIDEAEHRRHYQALLGTRGGELATRTLRKLLSEALAKHLQSSGAVKDKRQLEAAGVFMGNGLVGLLTWWFDSRAPLSGDQMYAIFERLAVPGIEALLKENGYRPGLASSGCLVALPAQGAREPRVVAGVAYLRGRGKQKSSKSGVPSEGPNDRRV
jgi:AcrR family transcriptional regulator